MIKGRRCSGFDDYDKPEPLKPYIRCGNLYGVAAPGDTSAAEYLLGAMAQQPLYTCASSVKAMIKTVEFTFNGTEALNSVNVSSVVDKTYASPADEPLWGVENVAPSQNLNISDINLLWGIVNNSYANDNEISTIRGEALYLPVAYFGTDMSVFRDSLAASSVFSAAWNSVYQEAAWISGASIGGLPSYSGDIQYSLYLKWRDLSRTQDGAAKILNLIWTDIVASAVVGTTTGFENNTVISSAGVLGQRAVNKNRSVVIYDNLLFAIPAFISLFLWTVLLVGAVILLTTRKVTCGMVIHYMNQTSLGRAVYDAEHPNREIALSSSKTWTRKVGKKSVGIRPYDIVNGDATEPLRGQSEVEEELVLSTMRRC